MIGTTWERTDDIMGHRPLFHIGCRFCDDRKMVVRHSGIMDIPHAPIFGEGNGANLMTYKCAECANVIRLYVVDTCEYLKEIRDKYRDGGVYYVPTDDEWSKEDKDIAKQLAALGYFGGRV